MAFVPLKDGHGGALTKYFGRVAGADEYKFRGIECRQRSTPKFIADIQRDFIETLDEYREPEAVADRLARHQNELRSGAINPQDLVIRTRASKPGEAYDQRTRTVAALERYDAHGIGRSPGQDVRYVVVDDDKKSMGRVRLHFEAEGYDPEFYSMLLVRAAESVLSPLGWDEPRIERYLRDTEDTRLTSWG